MKKLKKSLSLILAICLMHTVMAGCKDEEVSTGSSDFSKRMNITVWQTQGTDYTPPKANIRHIKSLFKH